MTTRTARRRFLQFLAASPLFSAEAPLITSPAQALNVREFEAVARKNIPPPTSPISPPASMTTAPSAPTLKPSPASNSAPAA
jgi:hypothetical protein